jgi:hypothetical protein
MSKAALEFLHEHGHQSLISLGCGEKLNRLDNHLKLLIGCGLNYYVGIDRVPQVSFDMDTAFLERRSALELLSSKFVGGVEGFVSNVRLFPNTYIEELANIFCKVVVCQRVLPFRRLEAIIASMHPELILQEDLIGCELQQMSRKLYKKTYPGIVYYQLRPFRPTGLIPGEKNLILWRRRDFFPCQVDTWPWHHRFFYRLLPKKKQQINCVDQVDFEQ